jgi:uncharacterized protein (TIGR02285 family)
VHKSLIFAGLFCCQSSFAADVTWLKTDWPPHQITTGLYQDQGTFDVMQKLLVNRLPHLTHQTQVVNLPRLEQAFLQRKKAVCSFGSLFSTPRTLTRWYSKAVAVLPGLAVHFRQSTDVRHYAAIQDNGHIDLAALVKDKSLTGAYQPNRFYPSSVMEAAQHANFIPQEFTSQINAASLLLSKRVDYVVEYPERMAFYLKQNQQKQQLQSLTVADASPYVVSYITCNKSEAGKQLIAEINTALMALWQTAEYKTAMFNWVDDASKDLLHSAYDEVQQQVASGADLKPE